MKVAASLVGCALRTIDASRELDGKNSVIRACFCCSYPSQEHKVWPWELCGKEILSLGIAVLDERRKLSGVAFKLPSSRQGKSPCALACG